MAIKLSTSTAKIFSLMVKESKKRELTLLLQVITENGEQMGCDGTSQSKPIAGDKSNYK
jgi:hypothetical protein